VLHSLGNLMSVHKGGVATIGIEAIYRRLTFRKGSGRKAGSRRIGGPKSETNGSKKNKDGNSLTVMERIKGVARSRRQKS